MSCVYYIDYTYVIKVDVCNISTDLSLLFQENLAKKRNLVKQSKMPELAESSETESMRGNGGSEHSEQDGAHKVSEHYMYMSRMEHPR